MEKILEEARRYAINNLGLLTTRNGFLAIFESIESEIDQVRQMVERNVKRVAGYGVRFDELESRIEALEEEVKLLRCDVKYLATYIPKPEPTVKEEIVTDKSGKPPGGLEKGDLIWNSWWECHGIFDYANQLSIYGWWAPNKSHGYKGGYDWFWRENVSFVSRPRFPDRKER